MGWRVVITAVAIAAAATPSAGAAITDPTSTVDAVLADAGDRRITYAGRITDRPDLRQIGVGGSGYWFARFDAPAGGPGPTGAGAVDRLPSWVGAFNHTASPEDPGCTEPGAVIRGCLPTYQFRTFSGDGPSESRARPGVWSTLRLPGGECGAAGAVVDPKTHSPDDPEYPDPTGLVFTGGTRPEPRNNNTINRIQLQDGVPGVFYVGVVTDTTAGDHDPGDLAVRGNVGLLDQPEERSQVEPDPFAIDLRPNGVPDVHVFRVQGFRPGDYLKLRLKGRDAGAFLAGFAGLVFDETSTPHPKGNARPPC